MSQILIPSDPVRLSTDVKIASMAGWINSWWLYRLHGTV